MINKYSNVPLYSQLKNLIIEKIECGEYAEESRIPSEQELCEHYDISRPTVRQAITELTNNGYLYKEKGKGTFVSMSKTKVDIKNYTGFTDSILDSQDPGLRNIISIRTIKGGELKCLEAIFGNSGGYGPQSDFAEIRYVTLQKTDVLSLSISYIPMSLFPGIIEDIRAKKPSYDIMRGKYPLLPVRTKSSLEIIYTGHDDAQYLQVQSGQPLLKIENVLLSKSGQVVEYVIAKYRSDKCKLIFENNK
jgi:DNA-binding GntR family transcriptional regulator